MGLSFKHLGGRQATLFASHDSESRAALRKGRFCATDAFSRRPLSSASRPFGRPILKVGSGSRLCKNFRAFSQEPVSFAFARP